MLFRLCVLLRDYFLFLKKFKDFTNSMSLFQEGKALLFVLFLDEIKTRR